MLLSLLGESKFLLVSIMDRNEEKDIFQECPFHLQKKTSANTLKTKVIGVLNLFCTTVTKYVRCTNFPPQKSLFI